MTCIVVISGADGAGKTTLAKAVMERFKGHATRFISIDDYSSSNHWYPDWLSQGGDRVFAVKKWRDAGCDPDRAVDTPDMKADLMAIKAAAELDYVVVEEPFGRLRKELAQLFDISIHISVPMDICLARATINNAANGVDPVEYLEKYIHSDLRVLFDAQNKAAASADLVVSGLDSVQNSANKAADCVRSSQQGSE